jgi:RHS repeat-associated protein
MGAVFSVPAAPDYAPSLAASGRRRPPRRATSKNSRLGFFGTPSGRTLGRRHLPHGTAPGYRGCGYKTASGRPKWLSRDPIGELGGINLYGYVGNNPVSFVDPYGLFAPAPAVVVGLAPVATAIGAVGTGALALAPVAAYGYYQLGNLIGDLNAPDASDFHGPGIQGAMPPPKPPGPPRGGAAASCPNSPNGENESTASGREAHKWWQPPEGYDTNFQFANGLKPDAINFDTQDILELKPNNPAAIRLGNQQVQGYINAAQQQFGGTWTGSVVTR